MEGSPMLDDTTFPLMRFKLRFSAALQIFLSAEGFGCLAEGRGRFTVRLRSVRFLRGLRGVFAVSCSSNKKVV